MALLRLERSTDTAWILHTSVRIPEGVRACPVVLLHGLGSSSEDWVFQRSALAHRWGTVALDLRGHGGSGPAERTFTIGDLAADVAATMDHLGLPQGHLVGLSLGATVGLQFGLEHGDRVRSLTLVNGFARLRPSPWGLVGGAGRLALALAAPMSWLGWWVARIVFPHEGQGTLRREAARRLAANDRGSYLRTMWAVARFDLREQLGAVGAPALVVAGAEDRVVPMESKVELAGALPNGRLAVVPGSGHVTPVDRPDRFNRLLTGFLEAVEEDEGGERIPESVVPSI